MCKVRIFTARSCLLGLVFSVPAIVETRAEDVVGDANCDQAVNSFDIDAFVLCLTFQQGWEALYSPDCDYYCVCDINGDGAVNSFDIDPFVKLLVGEPPQQAIQVTACPDGWLPQGREPGTNTGDPGNSVDFTATITQGEAARIRFHLCCSSSEPGVCMNYGEESGDDSDLKFIQTADVNPPALFDPPSPDGLSITTKNEVLAVTVTVTCYDWGAYGKIRATCLEEDKRGGGAVTDTEDIPVDENNNRIADGADQDTGPGGSSDALDDLDNTPAGDGADGDNLSRYEEYRGFMINGTHTRTSVVNKDVFIRNVDVADGGPSGHMSEATLGAPVHAISATEWNAQREINFNYDTAHLADCQTAVKVTEGTPAGSWGEALCTAEPWVPNRLVHCWVNVTLIRDDGATLSAAIDGAATAIPVVDVDAYWSAHICTLFDWGAFKIDDEIIQYDGVDTTGNTFAVLQRGAMGTAAAPHAAGAGVSNFADAAHFIKQIVAHEAGHIVGLEDDYATGGAPHNNWPEHIMNGWTQPGAYSGHGYTSTTYGTSMAGEFRVKP